MHRSEGFSVLAEEAECGVCDDGHPAVCLWFRVLNEGQHGFKESAQRKAVPH